MVDWITICKKIAIDDSAFDLRKWRNIAKTESYDNFYFLNIKSVKFFYFPLTFRFVIQGKIINLNNEISINNFDDIYGINDFTSFFTETNIVINNLFKTELNLDIRTFKVTKIDYCFNINTKYTSQYIKLFNNIFSWNNYNHHENYVLSWQEKFEMQGSFYIKTKSDYKRNIKSNYAINFYNKHHQLKFRLKESIENGKKSNITQADITQAKDILRLEVQCSYRYLQSICDKFKIDKETKSLVELLNIDIAKYVISHKYLQFFKYKDADFYNYKVVKALVVDDFKLKKFVLKISQGQNVTTNERKTQGAKLIKLNINPLGFTKDIDEGFLINPLKLLEQKLEKLGVIK